MGKRCVLTLLGLALAVVLLAAAWRSPERQRADPAGNRSPHSKRPTGATRAKSGEPLAQQPGRRALVEQAFQQVLGRSPGPDELRYWLAVPANDPRVQTEQALVRQQRLFLERFPAARAAVIQRAFAAALHCTPNAAAQGAWDLLIETSGTTYAELVTQLQHLGPAARTQCAH
ncbi:MAG: hypothetical protein EPN33_05215 [Acidobacteria bacterium]|nr:MAG: hypothetical protein EPN33_05215 [Acidobacteriota bacterium]